LGKQHRLHRDVPFSEEMFTRLGDTYRRIRNTLRILLGNLTIYLYSRGQEYPCRRISGRMKVRRLWIDRRWILQRLDDVIRDCRSLMKRFEFHKVYHTLNQFCAVDLSSLYVDITKDRMYCDAADSPRRRATQVSCMKFSTRCADCSRQFSLYRRGSVALFSPQWGSVHLQEFPEPEDRSG
jgi:isoleucyl-tRNA synthetase